MKTLNQFKQFITDNNIQIASLDELNESIDEQDRCFDGYNEFKHLLAISIDNYFQAGKIETCDIVQKAAIYIDDIYGCGCGC